MKKLILWTSLLLGYLPTVLAQETGAGNHWRWTAQLIILHNQLTSTYAVIADGPNSSLELETKPGWFFGVSGGVERPIGNRAAVGLQLGYQQQGVREAGTINFREGNPEHVKQRWTIHQLAAPVYGLYYMGKPGARVAAYLRLTLTPVATLAESGDLRGITLRARSLGLNGDGEAGISMKFGAASSLRLGLAPLGASLLPFDRSGREHFLYQTIRLQFSKRTRISEN